MQLTIEMIVKSLGAMASIGASFIVVRTKVQELEATLRTVVERLTALDTT